ncbi:hypothetical protein DICPUDRAFT_156016 [Dictyostelium purpureum]|uniref:Uncharacterized protein n=1 Tax=Dictyostelium purpureum TaxID=5786 RepID=F0ZVH0_DICPU|nr:uncharacterized protein DICPUDRAFT_156016 [Dictyostelium purpureum]EGC32064.1 hypothetical protein DICPUDRAFT_156016 [Dictyostelium purpureum]|eukprot:XP_003291418.1 hypothetical protein DICPUDRAFT_156016 [Dictyostelium purpureum]
MRRNTNQNKKNAPVVQKSVFNNLDLDSSSEDEKQIEEVTASTKNLNVQQPQVQQPEVDSTPRPYSGGFISTMEIPEYYPIDFSDRAQVTFNTTCFVKQSEYDIIKEVLDKFKPFVKLNNNVYEISKSSKITGKAFQDFQDELKKTKVKSLNIRTILTIKSKNPEDCEDISKWIEKQVANFVPSNYPTKVSTFVVSQSANFTFKSMIPNFDSINVPYQLYERANASNATVTPSTSEEKVINNNKIIVCDDESSSKENIVAALTAPLLEANQSLVGAANSDKKIKCSLKFGNSIFYQLSATAFLPGFSKEQLSQMETYKDFRSKQDSIIKESDFNTIAKHIKDSSSIYQAKETDATIYRVFIGNYKVRLVNETEEKLKIKAISQLDERVVTLDTVYPSNLSNKVGCRVAISKSKNIEKETLPKNILTFLESTTKDKSGNYLSFPSDFYKTRSFSKSQTTFVNNETKNVIHLVKITEEKRDEVYYSIRISNPLIKFTNKSSEEQFKQTLDSIYSEYQSLVNKL